MSTKLKELEKEELRDLINKTHNQYLIVLAKKLLEALERIEELEKQVKSVLPGGEHNPIISDVDRYPVEYYEEGDDGYSFGFVDDDD